MTGIATAIVAAAVIGAGVSMHQGTQAQKSAKSRAEAEIARQKAAEQKLQEEQATASTQASEISKRRRIAQSKYSNIYTSPLGISGQANVARKTILGA